MLYQAVTHVLFDMDGLILNTEDLYTTAFQNIVSKYGKDYTWDLKVKLMGLHTRETAEAIIKELELPMTVENFLEESSQQFNNLFPESKVLPGADKIIEHLHKKNVPIALATSSSEEDYNLKVNKHHKKLFSLFPIKVFGTSEPDVKKGKPSPDIFLVTAKKFPDKPAPEKCLVFEDSVNGVRAAKAGGMQVVMVPDPRVDEMSKSEATLVLKSLEEFKPELFGLPPFEK